MQRVMALCCLPTVVASVEVDGELYRDGSFTVNPPPAPLVASQDAQDLLVVQINPLARVETPRSMADIGNGSNEAAFNISFVREANALLHTRAAPNEEGGEAVRLHLISALDTLQELSISSKSNAEPAFLQWPHDRGVRAAEAWLAQHLEHVGVRATMDPGPVFHPRAA